MQLIVQIVGYKNTGKTTLVCRLTKRFKQAGYKVGTIKRDAHDFEIDTIGTDTWKHREAGADITAITSANRTAIMKQHTESLDQLIAQMPEANVILIEGFKDASYPKIIMIRTSVDIELLHSVTIPLAAAYWPTANSETIVRSAISVIEVNDIDQLYQKVLSISSEL